MVETTSMTKMELINVINEIKTKYHDGGHIIWFYREIKLLKDAIKTNISAKLYQDFQRELKCVYYESIYGDGDKNKIMTILFLSFDKKNLLN